MPTQTASNADRPAGLQWDFARGGFAKGILSLGGFAALYMLLVLVGLELHENIEPLTIIWPAAGLLFMALWLSPRRNWMWILAVQVSIELLSSAIIQDQFQVLRSLSFAVANSIDAAVGAWIASRLILPDSPDRVMRPSIMQ